MREFLIAVSVFFLSLLLPRSQIVKKRSINDKEVLGKKKYHLSEIWQFFHSTDDVFTSKIMDGLRARKQEQEEKGTTISAPEA